MISPCQDQQPPWGEGLEGPHQMLAFTQSHGNASCKAPQLNIYSPLRGCKPTAHRLIQAPRLGYSVSGAGPATGSGLLCAGGGAQAAPGVFTRAQLRAVPPGGALLLAMAEEQAPQHKHKSSGCLSTSTGIHWPEQVRGQAQSQWGEERGDSASRERGEHFPSKPNYSTSILDIFKKTSCDSQAQPGLRTTDLRSRCLSASQNEIRLHSFYFIS